MTAELWRKGSRTGDGVQRQMGSHGRAAMASRTGWCLSRGRGWAARLLRKGFPGSPPSSPGAAGSLLVLHPQPGEHKAAASNADSAVRLPSSSPAERTCRDTAGGGGEASGWGVWGRVRWGKGRMAVSFPQSASRAPRCLHQPECKSTPRLQLCLGAQGRAGCGVRGPGRPQRQALCWQDGYARRSGGEAPGRLKTRPRSLKENKHLCPGILQGGGWCHWDPLPAQGSGPFGRVHVPWFLCLF